MKAYYPTRIEKHKYYAIRFQTSETDNITDCWLSGFGSDFAADRVSFSEIKPRPSHSAKDVKEFIRRPDNFIGDGIITLMEYEEA